MLAHGLASTLRGGSHLPANSINPRSSLSLTCTYAGLKGRITDRFRTQRANRSAHYTTILFRRPSLPQHVDLLHQPHMLIPGSPRLSIMSDVSVTPPGKYLSTDYTARQSSNEPLRAPPRRRRIASYQRNAIHSVGQRLPLLATQYPSILL